MNQGYEMEKLEQKVFRSFFQDGLWDIYGGLIMLGFGIGMMTGKTIWNIVFIAMALILIVLRKRIVMSRMGNVRFSQTREMQVKRNKFIAVIVGVVFLLLGIFIMFLFSAGNIAPWVMMILRGYFLVIFGAILAGVVSVAAYVIGVRRYYVYAALVFVAFTAGQLAERYSDSIDAGVMVTLAGFIIFIVGLIIFIRFLNKYPRQPTDELG